MCPISLTNSDAELFEGLHYIKSGQGPPLIALHGFGATSFSWRFIEPALREHNTIYLFDLRGHGRSEFCPVEQYALQNQADVICEFIRKKNLSEVCLLGHSMGGGVALLAAASLCSTQERRLRALALLDSIALPQRLPLFFKIMRLPLLARFLTSLFPKEFIVRQIMAAAFFDKSKITSLSIEAYAKNLQSRTGVEALISTAEQMIPPNIELLMMQFSLIDVPTVLIWGKEDKFVPPSVAIGLNVLLPRSRLFFIDSCGHLPQEERPEPTTKILNEFLLEVARDRWKAV
jgi:pimeloyl-ACP methyl ester carboxylesterase